MVGTGAVLYGKWAGVGCNSTGPHQCWWVLLELAVSVQMGVPGIFTMVGFRIQET